VFVPRLEPSDFRIRVKSVAIVSDGCTSIFTSCWATDIRCAAENWPFKRPIYFTEVSTLLLVPSEPVFLSVSRIQVHIGTLD
jgi:hypothetical protein